MRPRDAFVSIWVVLAVMFTVSGRLPEAPVVDVAVWPTSVEIAPDEQVQFYAALLRLDGTVDCDVPPAAPGALYESGSFLGGCDSAVALLQDTVTRALRYRWPAQPLYDHDSLVYEISVRRFSLPDPTIFHRTQDTVFVWDGGQPDSLYWAKARAFYYLNGVEEVGPYGDSVSALFPSELTQPWVPLAVEPVLVDTTQVP
ncbi:MAG: hypothetical protein GTO63_30295 [Anaerolineae bacterium]|nr:hypothetical protein [Anaerolineae bacterium]NIN98996.1 hypothetical protein [Anaerolineae bacterium]